VYQFMDGVHGRRQKTSCILARNLCMACNLPTAGDDASGAIYFCD
jgi:hypothetical protein